MSHWFHTMTGWMARRRQGGGAISGGASSSRDVGGRLIQVGGIEIDPARHRVRAAGRDVTVTAMEIRILALLARRPGVVFTREQIAQACHDRNTAIASDSVSKRIQVLRRKLGVPGEGEAITTVRGVGYVLQPPVTRRDVAVRGSFWGALAAWWAGVMGSPRPTLAGVVKTAGAVAGMALAVGGAATVGTMHTGDWLGRPAAELVGEAELPALTMDAANVEQVLNGFSYDMMVAGLGSGIDYAGDGNRYTAVVDRGPDEATSGFAARFYELRISVDASATEPVQLTVHGVTALRDEAGRPLLGASALLGEPGSGAERFDAEAVRVGPQGTLWIADEYGPGVAEFDRGGRRLRTLPIPERFSVQYPHAKAHHERRANLRGRLPNRGFEGLALSRDGKTLYTTTQSPLVQDGGEAGLHLRLLRIDVETGASREAIYTLEDPGHCVSEIAWLAEDELLVLERDMERGTAARCKRIYRVDLAGASDVSSAASLPPDRLPTELVPVHKSLVVDLLDPHHGLAGQTFPEQVEGMALGPDLPDGRRLLIVSSDSGFTYPAYTRFYAFALDAMAHQNLSSTAVGEGR